MPRKKVEKTVREIGIAYGTIESLIETHLRMMKVIHDGEEMIDIKWPLGDEQLNHCHPSTVLDLKITTIKDDH